MGLMNLITRSYQAMFGVRRDQTEIDNWREGKGAPPDRPITTNPFPQPYQRPEDFDAYGRENDVMRMEYQRFYANESTLQSALDGKVAAIAALDISILPADENSKADKYVAEFVRKAVANCSGGWPGLIQNMLQPAFVNGFSITEKWTGAVDTDLCFDRLRPMYNGLWAYRRLASIDTNKIRFQVNDVRDIVGIINTQWGLHGYSPERVVIYTHRKIFENPYGRSDIRSAYRACQMIENAYKLWYIALKNYSAPYIKAKTSATGAALKALSKALEAAKAGGWLTTGKDDEVDLLNFAGATSYQAFEAKVKIAREEIYQAIRGAYLPFLQGNNKTDQGNTETHKVASDSIEYLIAQSVCQAIDQQVIPHLVRPNFGDKVGLPSISLGGTNWVETKNQLDVIRMVEKELGRPVSTAHIYKVAQVEPPRDATDGPPPMQQQAMLPQTMLPNPFGPTASTGPTPIGTNPVGSTPALPPASGTTAGTTAAPNSPKPTTGNVPNPEGNQAPVVVQGASELLNTVGGASAILELQKQYVAGAITRDMAIANATAIYGITRENVEALFPAGVPIAKPVAEPTDAKGGSADQPAETFSEQDDEPEVKIAIAGPDGQAAIHLTERAMADGRALLASIARDAVERRLKEGGAGQGPFFNDDERELLAEAIASTNATAELLGRYRIREQVQSSDLTVRFAAFDAADSPLRVKPIPPEEALRFFHDLMPSMNLDPEFTDRHRRLSFTLAANTGEVMLRAVQDAITEALANGTTGTYAVQSILDAAGVTPRSPDYAQMVFRTNAIDAYNTGADDERQDPDVAEEFPVWQYLGIEDGRQGKDHEPHFGKYFPASVTFNQVRGDRPFNCRCSQRVVSKREWERLQAAGAREEERW